MSMRRFRLMLAWLAPVVLLAMAAPGHANTIQTSTGTVTCSSYSLVFNFIDLDISTVYTVDYTILLTPSSGTPITISSSTTFTASSATQTVDASGALGPLTAGYTISGSATLVGQNMVGINFTSSSISCSTASGACPATPGFWKNHNFPSTVQTSGLKIGGVTYTASELESILENNGGNAVAILGRQLVAALLNKAAGTVDNTAADAAISTAESLLSTHSLDLLTSDVGPNSALGQALLAPEGTLDKYNNADFHTCSEGSGLLIS